MGRPSDHIMPLLVELQKVLNELIAFFQSGPDPELMVYKEWNVRQVLAHITFWHESFARNVKALSLGNQPPVLRGKLSDVNRRSVAQAADYDVSNWIARLKHAQSVIAQYIIDPSIELIPYKVGSRPYGPEEHLQVATRHMAKHLKDLKNAVAHAKTQEQEGTT